LCFLLLFTYVGGGCGARTDKMKSELGRGQRKVKRNIYRDQKCCSRCSLCNGRGLWNGTRLLGSSYCERHPTVSENSLYNGRSFTELYAWQMLPLHPVYSLPVPWKSLSVRDGSNNPSPL